MGEEQNVGRTGMLFREGQEPVEGKIKRYQAGRDAGDHLIEFVDGPGDGSGTVVRKWYVVRPKGTNENGTFEIDDLPSAPAVEPGPSGQEAEGRVHGHHGHGHGHENQ